MRRLRPGPELDEALRRMEEHWAAEEAALRDLPFSVLGLADGGHVKLPTGGH